MCDHFKISKISRAGVRFISLGSIGAKNADLTELFRTLVDQATLSVAAKALGTVNDYGIKVDGSADDNIKYHLSFGPFKDKDFDLQFQHERQDNLRANLITDIDLYEEKFTLTVSPSVWIRSMILKASAYSVQTEDVLNQKLDLI
jgi:hypothetical protein